MSIFKHNGKVVAIEKDGKTAIMRRNKKWHLMRLYNGIGISEDVLAIMWKKGIRKLLLILETEKGEKLYKTWLINFWDYGIRWRNIEEDGKIDVQRILPLKFWQEDKEVCSHAKKSIG